MQAAAMRRFFVVPLLALAWLGARDSAASPSRPDYQYFRALAIDLLGRPPLRDEIRDFERPDFQIETWIDAHLSGARYAERLRRIYMDLLRLELPPSFRFEPAVAALRRISVAGPEGKSVAVYFRIGQRRLKPEIDGSFCFTEPETGIKMAPDGQAIGTSHPITKALLDERTVEVKPWWLYADYRSAHPADRASAEWARRFPGYELALSMFLDVDGAETTAVRV